MKRLIALVLIVRLGMAGPAFAQTLGQGGGAEVSIWRVLLSLLFCLMLAAVALSLLRRHLSSRSIGSLSWLGSLRRLGLGRLSRLGVPREEVKRRIKLADQQYLGPQRCLYLIEIDGQPYAALFAPQAASLIALSAPADAFEARAETRQP